MKKKVKILIRFDDICPTMNYGQWEKADEILKKYNIKPLLGIIPDCQDPDLRIDDARENFWEWVRDLQKSGYTLAMHGCYHLYRTKKLGIAFDGYNSEFVGLPYGEQYKMIKYGKEVLAEHGIHTDIFFAPAHSYDENTLKVLSACGFRYLSDGQSSKAYLLSGIKCLPCRSGGVPRIWKSGYYTAIFHAHEWTREDKKIDYIRLKKFCKLYHKNIVSFDEYKEQPLGNVKVQRFLERRYVFYYRNIKPGLVIIKNISTKLLQRLIEIKRYEN